MRSNRAWILTGVALAAGVGVAYVLSGRRIQLTGGDRILLIGDSMGVGLAPHLAGLARDEGIEFRSIAVGGTTIRDWTAGSQAAALRGALAAFDPTVVLVSLGTNDEYLSEASLAEEHEHLEALLDELGGLAVAWIGPPSLPLKDDGDARAMIRETSVPYFASDRLDIPRSPDQLHPTVAGYGAWAGMLWSWLS